MGIQEQDKLSSLDALRGALALIVVAAHSWQIFYRPLENGATLNAHLFGLSARIAVLCFFCLSGYVIALSLDANRRRNGRFAAGDYATSRLFRIAPPLLVIIGLTFVAQMVLVVTNADLMLFGKAARQMYCSDPASQLLALLSLCTRGELTGNWLNGPLWSLKFEIRLYVVAGAIAAILWWPGLLRKVFAAACLLLFLGEIGMPVTSGLRLDLQATCFVAFGLGSAAYVLRRVPATAVFAVIAASIACAALLLLARGETGVLSGLDSVGMLRVQAVASVALAGFVLLMSRTRATRALKESGRYSYTLYIGHFPLLLFLYFISYHSIPAALTPRWAPVSTVVAMVTTWFLLAALGRWIERPGEQRVWLMQAVGRLRGRTAANA